MENVHIYYGKIWLRLVAKVTDGLILLLPTVIIALLLPKSIFKDMVTVLIMVGYNVYYLSTKGQTPGKKYVGLRVISDDMNLTKPSIIKLIFREVSIICTFSLAIFSRWQKTSGFNETFIENLILGFSSLLTFYGIANVISIFVTRKHKALHDYLSGTIVIDARKMDREQRKSEHWQRLLNILKND